MSSSNSQSVQNNVSNNPGQSDTYDVLKVREISLEAEKRGVAALPPLPDSLEEFYITISVADGWESRCKVIKPRSSTTSTTTTKTRGCPLIVYFHGGGYSFGSPEQVTRPAREWAEEHNAVVVCPSYRQTPEHPWPQPFKDAWDVVSYLSRHAETDHTLFDGAVVNLTRGFVVGGFSAGGGLAAVVGAIAALSDSHPQYAATQLAPPVAEAERLARPITGLFVAIALLLVDEIVPAAYKDQGLYTAMVDNAHDPVLNAAGVRGILKNLKCTDYTSPWFSPVNVLPGATSSDEQGGSVPVVQAHPPTYVQSCGKTPVRDDVLIYERMLANLPGMHSKTKVDLFPNDGHAAWTALPDSSASKDPTIEEATLQGMRWLLEFTDNNQ